MAMGSLFWEQGAYSALEQLFRQNAEFCSEHDVWKLNVAHTFFMQVCVPSSWDLYSPNSRGQALTAGRTHARTHTSSVVAPRVGVLFRRRGYPSAGVQPTYSLRPGLLVPTCSRAMHTADSCV